MAKKRKPNRRRMTNWNLFFFVVGVWVVILASMAVNFYVRGLL